MRLLLGVDRSKVFHVNEFAKTLSKVGIECKIVIDSDIYDGFPSRRVSSWFQTAKKAHNLFEEFEPDAVFVDRHGHFAKAVLDAGLPLLSHLRGDYWSEIKWYLETIGRDPVKRVGRHIKSRIEEKCFQDATMILPICNYLNDIVRRRYPGKNSFTLYQGIAPNRWHLDDVADTTSLAVNITHPCVGLLQDSSIWCKAREMLTLSRVIKTMPETTFYWAGDGPYRNKILEALSKYDNFKWLGTLSYPHTVRQYLKEIDLYALISGIDMSPLTLQEAQLMEKPVLATRVGGIPELMQDGVSGVLVNPQSPDEIIKNVDEMLCDDTRSTKMGKAGRRFISENFNWDKITSDFVDIVKPVVG